VSVNVAERIEIGPKQKGTQIVMTEPVTLEVFTDYV
jgi:hypothetical protein